jgi:hypothetical protein
MQTDRDIPQIMTDNSLSLGDQSECVLHDRKRCSSLIGCDFLQDSSDCIHPRAMAWDGRDTVPNLTTRSNWQFMPDKGNFCGILVRKNND